MTSDTFFRRLHGTLGLACIAIAWAGVKFAGMTAEDSFTLLAAGAFNVGIAALWFRD
ncbi:hypothetical protein ACFOGJ_09080 [Marinibaculum pumilum]|uniref:Uncharacterized protein n=1 Tax=Marinibaculum pumilum TaxID=1766165 RepID=A0ABV7KYK0_9PROT